MKTYSFYVKGPLVGAVRTTRRQMWVDPRYKRYEAFKREIRLLANTVGVPDELTGYASVNIFVEWKRKARVDLDNLAKSALDALWTQDRKVNKLYCDAFENTGVEQMRVCVTL